MSTDADAVLNDVLNPPPQPEQPAPDAAVNQRDDADTITMSKSAYDAMQGKIQQFDSVAPILEELQANPGLIHDLRAQRVQQPTQNKTVDQSAALDEMDQQFNYEKPGSSAARIADQVARAAMQPAATQINVKLAGLAISNFKATKTADPFYAAVSPLFDKKITNADRAWIGSQDDEWIQRTLQMAWNASLGEYVAAQQTQRAKNPPPVNLGGGAGAGSSATTAMERLAELDPVAHRMALAGGLDEASVAQIVKELE